MPSVDTPPKLTRNATELRKHSDKSNTRAQDAKFPDKANVRTDDEEYQIVALRMDIQIYEMDQGVYLVDFKLVGYETENGSVYEDKEVTSAFPFLDMAAKLIMQLADSD